METAVVESGIFWGYGKENGNYYYYILGLCKDSSYRSP